ncbi:MAG TPA: PKD domain-containing protein, partial [Ohtaekwangia sp.]|nr:PKD domain-containing protein [Ohtaekwangia sp.]
MITLDGANRTPDPHMAQVGSLKAISYPWGGSTTIDYQLASFYDETAAQNITGGGLRVSKIVYFDGLNVSANITKNFYYEEIPGKSSGRILYRPSFAIPTYEYRDPSSGAVGSYATLAGGSAQTLWEKLTVRTETDLSPASTTLGSYVGYKFVTVERPGTGKAVFEFSLPGAFGESSSGAWTSTLNKFARGTGCPALGIVTAGGTYAYPYAPVPNFDYERGLLTKKSEFNESGTKVREIINTYQLLAKTGSTPFNVWGAQYDKYPYSSDLASNTNYFFGKYFYLTDVTKVLGSETTTIYDSANAAKKLVTSTEYFYEGTGHKLLTRIKTTNSEGTIYTSQMRYPLDYGTLPANIDKPLEMIKKLQTSFRNGTVIEQKTTAQRTGQPEKVTGASLIKLNDFGTDKALLQYTLTLNIANGITDFVVSDKLLQAGTYVLNHDGRYEVTNTILAYDDFQKPLSSVGRGKIPVSMHWGHEKTLPVVTAKNATHNQFAYSNFETDPADPTQASGYEFEVDQVVTGPGRTGQNASHPVVKLSRTIEKAASPDYILSFWLKKQSAGVDFKVEIKNTALTTTYYTTTFTATPAGSNFEYIERIIPASSFPSTFVVEVQGQFPGGTNPVSSPALLPLIDDVAFYPGNAEITTMSYTIPFGVAAVTDTRGVSGFTEYDKLGRVTRRRDHDNNIINRQSYAFAAIPAVFKPIFSWSPSPAIVNSPVTFEARSLGCFETPPTYAWSIDGNAFTGQTTAYTFTATGDYAITLTATHPDFPEPVSVERTIKITDPPIPPLVATICA